MTIILYSLIFTSITLFINSGLIILLIGLMQLNITIYGLLKSKNYRNWYNYIILSTIVIMLIIIKYIIPLDIKWIDYICYISILIKLSAFPFTYWSITIYENLEILKAFIIIISSKLSYYLVISNINITDIIWILIYLTIIGGSIIALNTQNLIYMIIYSGTIHIGFLILPLITDNILLSMHYLFIYLLSLIVIYIIHDQHVNINIRYIQFSILIYMLIGLPPFYGFYFKYYSLIDLMNITDNILYLSIFITFIIASLFISYIYINYLNCILVFNYTIKNIKFSSYFILLLFILYPLYIL